LSDRSSTTQVVDVASVNTVAPVSVSDGHKSDSLSGSDALPDDIERMFDRASFSIQVEPQNPPSESFSDPDGLRKDLSALLEGRISVDNHSASAGDTQNVHRTPVDANRPHPDHTGSASSMTPNPSSSLASISGVLFSDPFVSTPPVRPTKDTDWKTSHSAKVRSDRPKRRISSVQIAKGEVPPVPIIPEAFQDSPKALLSSQTKPNETFRYSSPNYISIGWKYGASDDRLQSSRISEPNYWPSIFEDVEIKYHGSSGDALSLTASYQRQSLISDGSPHVSDGGFPSANKGTKPNIIDVIHPHSPVQTVKPFPRRFSSRPQQDVKLSHIAADPQQARRQSISMTYGMQAIDPQVQNYVEKRLQVPISMNNA
jgi:hypothetical protein